MPSSTSEPATSTTITYNRPDVLNAVNGEMRRDLNDAFARFRDEEEAWVAIVTGAGRAFCAGADLRDGAGAIGDFAGSFWEKPTVNSFESGWEIYKPVIAAVNGHCLGYGLTLVTWCDFVLASDRARFGYPEAAHRDPGHGGGHPSPAEASPGPTPWNCS
jgi:E-phenylitaconyl-CoA hydratase